MGSRVVITESTIRQALSEGRTTLEHPANAIVTPLAREVAQSSGCELVVAEQPVHYPRSEIGNRSCAIGSDHGGFELKSILVDFLGELDWQVLDVGTNSARRCDYPDFAYAVSRAVSDGRTALGIMIDGAGVGSAIVCNKVPGIRAAPAATEFVAWNSRAHNNCNVLTLGSRVCGVEVCKRIVRTFLATPFEGGRHEGRVGKIDDVERRFALD